MWKKPSETANGDFCWYTVYYCPKCKKQRTWHTINKNLWKCDICGLVMKYRYKDKKLHIT